MCAFALAQRGNWTRSVVLLSREDSTTKAFTLVNVYDCPIASWNCRSLSLGAKYSDVVRRRGKSRPMLFQRHFAFYYQRYQSNASAEYFRSYEMRVQTRSWGWDLFYLLANLFTHIFSLSLSLPLSLSLSLSLSRARTFRSINVTGSYLFFPFSGYIPVQDLVLFFASISYPCGFRNRFSFLLPFPLVGGHFLLFTSLSAPLSVPSVVRSLFAVISVDLRGFWTWW